MFPLSSVAMRKGVISKAGIAAVVILAPGGFILGLALLAKHYRSAWQGSPTTNCDEADGDKPPASAATASIS